MEYDKLGYGSIMLLDEIAFNGWSDLNRVAGSSLTVLIYVHEILDPIVRSCRCAMGCNASHHTVHVVIEMDWSAWSL